MKKFLIVLFAGSISGSAMAGNIYAQSSGNVFVYTDAKAFASSLSGVAIWQDLFYTDSASAPELKYINLRAGKDFSQRFNGATEEKWYALKEGYVSYFKLNGFGNRAFYNRRGEWQASLVAMDEKSLPKEIRAAVKSTYYDYKITFAEDIETHEGGVYIVHVEDQDNIKVLRVTKDGDMETMQNIRKI